MHRAIEILAPGGDKDAIKAAILAGADAVYCGLNKFNARNRATNILFEDLPGLIRLAHQQECKIFLTINIIIYDEEFPNLIRLLNKLVNTQIDGLIVQDLGLLNILQYHFPSLVVHASTQMTTHNKGQIDFLAQQKVRRVNLSRELNIDEIEALTQYAHEKDVFTEVFVHGSYCISFSGICYMSSVLSGRSGNRGQCSQHCREAYKTTDVEKNYPLNFKDNSAFTDLKALADAQVDSLKIEGRIKEFDYVYTATRAWKQHVQDFQDNGHLNKDKNELYSVFNRDFTNGFLKGKISKDMFIDNPMGYSVDHLINSNNFNSVLEKEKAVQGYYDQKEDRRNTIQQLIDELDDSIQSVSIDIEGQEFEALKLILSIDKEQHVFYSKSKLSKKGKEPLSLNLLQKKISGLPEGYFVDSFNIKQLEEGLYLPFSDLADLKKQLFYKLNADKAYTPPVKLPSLIHESKQNNLLSDRKQWAILIDQIEDIQLTEHFEGSVFYKIPNSLKGRLDEFIQLFTKHSNLMLWFPAILIGDDFQLAIDLLQSVKAEKIVSNNTSIALEAQKLNIDWIAGPYLNISNSYALKAIKEHFNASGAFLSNELSTKQISSIKKPMDFDLYFQLLHPNVLMTSRQCLFHQVTGCEKYILDQTCIKSCVKTASIENLSDEKFIIEKSKGNFHNLYHEKYCLALKVFNDPTNPVSTYMLDLRSLDVPQKIEKKEKLVLIQSFAEAANGNIEAEQSIKNRFEKLK